MQVASCGVMFVVGGPSPWKLPGPVLPRRSGNTQDWPASAVFCAVACAARGNINLTRTVSPLVEPPQPWPAGQGCSSRRLLRATHRVAGVPRSHLTAVLLSFCTGEATGRRSGGPGAADHGSQDRPGGAGEQGVTLTQNPSPHVRTAEQTPCSRRTGSMTAVLGRQARALLVPLRECWQHVMALESDLQVLEDNV